MKLNAHHTSGNLVKLSDKKGRTFPREIEAQSLNYEAMPNKGICTKGTHPRKNWTAAWVWWSLSSSEGGYACSALRTLLKHQTFSDSNPKFHTRDSEKR